MTKAKNLSKEIAFSLYFPPLVFAVISIPTYSFIMMDLVGSSAGSSSSILAGLGTWSNNKKKTHIKSVYFYGSLYKKSKTPGASNDTVDLSTGPISIDVLYAGGMEHKVSWSSEVESEDASVSGVSDIENINNMVAEKTNYVDSNDSEADNMKLSFNNVSDVDDVLKLPLHMFNGFNQLPLVKSCASETRSFDSTKSFALDVEHSAVPGKSISEKLIFLKKFFYQVGGFGGASTSSKFSGIIKLTFTSESSLNKAKLMAINKKVVVNTNLKKVNSHTNWEIIVKEIPVDLLRSAIETVFSKFGKIVSVKLQLIGLWQKALVEYKLSEMTDLVAARWSVLMEKDSVCVAKVISNKQTWVLRDQHQALLYTLPVGTTAHDLSGLLESYGKKTCFIGRNPFLYVRDQCAVICFENEAFKLAAVGSVPVFKGVNLHWAGLCLAYCIQYTYFSYITANCSVSGSSGVHGRRVVFDQDHVHLAVIYKKKSAPVSRLTLFGKRTWASVVGVPPGVSFRQQVSSSDSIDNGKFLSLVVNDLEKWLVSIKSSLVSLMGQIGELAKRLESLVPAVSQSSPGCQPLVTPPITESRGGYSNGSGFGSKFWLHEIWYCNYYGLISGKTCVQDSRDAWLAPADEINSLITRAMNESSFIILGGDFNKDRSYKCASFKKCFDLGLVNSLGRSFLDKLPTWYNSHGVAKTIDYVFLSFNLVNAIIDCNMLNVDDFFDTDYKSVSVSVGLSGLLDTRLSSMYKQANKDHWKFDVKDANKLKWAEFRDDMAANTFICIWDIICEIMIFSAGGTFKKKWFKGFDSVFNKVSSKFHKLELLVSKLVKAFHLISGGDFALLLDTWDRLDSVGTLSVKSFFLSGSGFDSICSELAKARKSYHSFKMLEFKHAEKSHIRQAIESRMESFELDKGRTIRSVLKHSFCKVVLDHLVVDDELVLESELVKSKVNEIMERWTRKWLVVSDFSDDWKCQFRLLDYIFDGAFSSVMNSISFDEMFSVISSLFDKKAAGFSGISNEFGSEYAFGAFESLPEGVLTNTYPIALIKTACKILSKILLDRISSACSEFNVLQEDNFSVLKGTTMQSPIFVVGFVVEDALEKNRELWLAGLTSFFAAGAFVDNTIWIGSSQATTQHILDVASEFFRINNISIDNNKTVAIPINCQVEIPYLTVSGLPIFIAKKGEPHHYLGIFLSSNGLLVPSLVKAYLDIRFFVNFVLKKAILNKQFSYLLVFWAAYFLTGLTTSRFLAGVLVTPCCFRLMLVWQTFKRWKKLDLHGPIPFWFDLFACFLGGVASSPMCFSLVRNFALSDVHQSHDFGVICDDLLATDTACLSVYTDGSLSGLGTVAMKAGAVVFFENINSGLGVRVSGLVFFILSEFHSDISGNKCVDKLTKDVILSTWHLSYSVSKCFLRIGGSVVSGNSKYFVHDVFWSILYAHWEVGSGSQILVAGLYDGIN
ncbi:hypothetical protein G9A89_021952 [Geosiphon pyriformis]|nr:hypothetical protein G9A89_021952 [Geosiphon pyriformis]